MPAVKCGVHGRAKKPCACCCDSEMPLDGAIITIVLKYLASELIEESRHAILNICDEQLGSIV